MNAETCVKAFRQNTSNSSISTFQHFGRQKPKNHLKANKNQPDLVNKTVKHCLCLSLLIMFPIYTINPEIPRNLPEKITE